VDAGAVPVEVIGWGAYAAISLFLGGSREMMFRLERTLGILVVWLLLMGTSLVSLAGAATQSVALDWDDNDEPDMDYYNVYRSTSNAGPYVKINTTGVRVSEYRDVSVEAGKVYFYKVTAVDTFANESNFSDLASVTLPAETPKTNADLVANAGPNEHISVETTVTLNGSQSLNPNGTISAYLWMQTSGPEVVLADETSSVTSFVAPMADSMTTLTFQLFVWDQDHVRCSVPSVTARTIVPGAIANAGSDQDVSVGQTVTLDGTQSKPTHDPIVAYFWLQKSGPTVQILDDASSRTTFVAPKVNKLTTLVFDLYVWDAHGFETMDRVNVKVHSEWPVAVAAAPEKKVVNPGDVVTLNGTASWDPDGQIVGYLWLQAQGSSIPVKIADENSSITTFVAPSVDAPTTMTFELYVWDNDLNRSAVAAQVVVRVENVGNRAPVANAGVDQKVKRTSKVTLDASKSSDPDGDPITFQWTQMSGMTVKLRDANTVRPSFTAPNVNVDSVLVFRVRLADGKYTDADDVQVVVTPRGQYAPTDE